MFWTSMGKQSNPRVHPGGWKPYCNLANTLLSFAIDVSEKGERSHFGLFSRSNQMQCGGSATPLNGRREQRSPIAHGRPRCASTGEWVVTDRERKRLKL